MVSTITHVVLKEFIVTVLVLRMKQAFGAWMHQVIILAIWTLTTPFPNTTSAMDAGVIMSFKCHYRRYSWKSCLIDTNLVLKIRKWAFCQLIVRAWNEVTQRTISKLFSNTHWKPQLLWKSVEGRSCYRSGTHRSGDYIYRGT